MDDLAGLNWTSSPSSATNPTPSKADYSSTSLRSTPVLTPQSAASISRPASTKPLPGAGFRLDASRDASSAAAGSGSNGLDSFSSLVNFGGKKAANTSSMSLLEQQKKMQEDKAKANLLQQQRLDQQFSGLDSLGSIGANATSNTGSNGFRPPFNRSTPSPNPSDQDDLLAGFSADAKVNRASHFPPPSAATPPTVTPSLLPSRPTPSPKPQQGLTASDPFDLDSFGSDLPSSHAQSAAVAGNNDDDDILGLLGKPVDEVKKKSPSPPPKPARHPRRPENEDLRSVARTPPPGKDPRDPAIAELVDMGFSVEDAKRALAETDTGLDVRAAIDYLLKEAHAKSKPSGHEHTREHAREHTRGRKTTSDREAREEYGGHSSRRNAGGRPAWQSQAQGEMQDVAAFAQEVGGNILKTAGSIWATGRKKMAQAINELQDDKNTGDNTPKWMREAQSQQQQQRSRSSRRPDDNFTTEAMMLDMGGDPRKGHSERSGRAARPEDDDERRRRQQARQHRERREESNQKPAVVDRRAELRAKVDEAEVYISPARRRPPRPTAAPTPPPKPQVAEADLLFGTASYPPVTESRSAPPPSTRARPASNNTPPPQPAPAPPRPATTAHSTPAHKPRQIPPVPQSTLASSTTSRAAGTEAFKRGDYPLALSHYTTSLSGIPTSHPIRYLILTNRAIVHIKLGDSKAAVEDCDDVISGVGSSRGVGETFDLGDGTNKDLKEIWGKAVVRRAEALEHLERWTDAGAAWGVALENGVGGASASAGKARCEKALAPKKPNPPPAAKKPPPPRTSRPAPRKPQTSAESAEAVSRLRAANAAADKADAEKFALHDSVEGRVLAWKGGKETNLRALIASLDMVLWEGCGWKKVGMHELVMPNKVKIAYMKGIAKVHPDKISQDATVEQRMLAAAVFSGLNDAWDDFKKQNNL
ncbi:hypothetical protein Dda_4268 [Drechslerella dactyloides]|uniref:UBA domain-containing protein n=1 Tax=Drechslerella dactyloides TaxID=74499 RepID=A0AAD6IZF1_DREDA|nr:hypothetical protein Dda_4268 [Drechslerella dactyloides]